MFVADPDDHRRPSRRPRRRSIAPSTWRAGRATPVRRPLPSAIEAYIGGTFQHAGVSTTHSPRTPPRADGKLGFSKRPTTAKTGNQQIYVYAKNVPGTPGADRLIGVVQVTIYVDPDGAEHQDHFRAGHRDAEGDVIQREVLRDRGERDLPVSLGRRRVISLPGLPTPCRADAGPAPISVRATDAYGNQDATRASDLCRYRRDRPPSHRRGSHPLGVVAKAVKKKSKLRINVGPDSASSNYRVVIQRKVGKRWRKVERVRTRGDKDKWWSISVAAATASSCRERRRCGPDEQHGAPQALTNLQVHALQLPATRSP